MQGLIQKGPFILGTEITARELDNDFVPTGRSFTGRIDENTGHFSVRGTFNYPYVELSANGFYFNELSDSLSAAPLTLSALANLADSAMVNVNVLTHLERGRVLALMDQGLDFAQAKAEAQAEALAVFNLIGNAIGNSEKLDIAQDGDGNAILLAVSVIAQGDRSEAQLSELLSILSNDLAPDGKLDSLSARQALLGSVEYLKPRRATVRANLVNRYAEMGIPVTIPPFEAYTFALDETPPQVSATWPEQADDLEVYRVNVTFSELMEHQSLNASTITLQNAVGQTITGSVHATDGTLATVASWLPDTPLTPGTYTLTVNAGVKDYAGNHPVAPVAVSFIHSPISQLSATNSGPTRLASAILLTATVPGNSPAIAYHWSFGDGSSREGREVSHTYAAVGNYTATVTATNSISEVVTSTVVTVIDREISVLQVINDGPTRLASSTTFTAAIEDGSNVTYAWNFGDGVTGSGAEVNHTYAAVGDYTATVTATNSVGEAVAANAVSVIDREIEGLGIIPSGDGLTWFWRGNNLEFTAAITDGSNVIYIWDFGDDVLGNGKTVSHTYDQIGEYTIVVTAANSVGQVVATDTVQIIGVAAIATNYSHTCAVLTTGGVKCWGLNEHGQLGDGKLTFVSKTPIDVIDGAGGTLGGVSAVTTGGSHTCALIITGGVKCWGANSGKLGDGTPTNRYTPVDVSDGAGGALSDIIAIDGGYTHTCALTSIGGVKCWGWNRYGQLGDGTTTGSYTSVDVSGGTNGTLSNVKAIATGYDHTCALTTTGGVKCWGYNGEGQLGDGTTIQRTTPVDVSGLGSGVTAIAVGRYHTCALTTEGGVKCWGSNYGDGTTTDHHTPVDVSDGADGVLSGVTAIATGAAHTCALITTGHIKCWGANGSGQLGDGTTENRSIPQEVSNGAGDTLNGISAIEGGYFHTCALPMMRGVKCWGWNEYGQLGDGTRTNRYTPVNVIGLGSGVTPAP